MEVGEGKHLIFYLQSFFLVKFNNQMLILHFPELVSSEFGVLLKVRFTGFLSK